MIVALGEKMYIGGWSTRADIKYHVWSKPLGHSFFGCLKDFQLNGIGINFAELLASQNNNESLAQVAIGCKETPKLCTQTSCANKGRCIEGWNRFQCDCSRIMKSGAFCEKGIDFRSKILFLRTEC